MKKTYLEFVVGLFLVLGILCLAYLSIEVARKEFFAVGGYDVQAMFSNCGSLRSGSPVTIAGVDIGRVENIRLEDYEAKVVLRVQSGIVLQRDVIASIKTKGLIGEVYVAISPGASTETIKPGGTIFNTEPAMDLESLISKFVQGTLAKPSL
ncbi:MAG: outer membrane lipid asymmetry maintenance protein MlaD [Candidatus Omnitrophica bacterium]|nr:outer membrane lipid asymmetry maintenance protein MlaD [Candidatus Omnitrophota bacterium]